ncbi:GNAT family N-acetyltransferase [Mesorhizobium sp.]|uniref:GNAT family N-acetyltransferase n=1 Tax=Mesorhizobium sp. TaxID=1871066 RepID=UPI0025CD8FEB|nr:GNAT family N-acetyltransferase [Mesorhizobium sp.]
MGGINISRNEQDATGVPMEYEIVPATEATMAEVEAWLDVEESIYKTAIEALEAEGYVGDEPPRGFRCNWDSVKRTWSEGNARVDILMVEGHAVGFLDGTDILEIRPDLRREGYGRLLADFMVDVAHNEGRSVLEIEIAPWTVEPFWKRMGFTVVPDRRGSGGGIYAYRILHKVYSFSDGERVSFSIQFYSEHERYRENPKPFSRFSGMGERLSDGSVQLPERAFCFEPIHSQHGDYFVSIELGGETIHFDKVKYETSKAKGIRLDAGYTYFIDRITPQSSPD